MNRRVVYLAAMIGNMFRVSQGDINNQIHDAMCSVLTAAADVSCNTKEQRERFMEIEQEAEISGV